jgi:hypothetical protein
MKTRRWVAVALLAFAGACNGEEPLDVSLVSLIANPHQFDGKVVRVVGFLHLEFEGNGLYLHKEDCDLAAYKNGVWIDPTGEHFHEAKSNNNKYVLVVGTFDATDQGHLGMWSGALNQVERLIPWPQK